jgi:hypothetical protein
MVVGAAAECRGEQQYYPDNEPARFHDAGWFMRWKISSSSERDACLARCENP